MGPYVTFDQWGSGILSQWRYALSRHSSIHSGSPFLVEISRMTSSLRPGGTRSEEHTSELQSRSDLVCRLLLEKKNESARRFVFFQVVGSKESQPLSSAHVL